MNIDHVLQKAGLDEKTRKTYRALLSLGEGTVKEIANKAQLKRPHVYNILEDLEKQRLVTRSLGAQKTVYVAEHPKLLLSHIVETKNAIAAILPDLVGIYNQHEKKPRIRVLEGIDGMKETYQEALSTKTLDLFGSLHEIKPQFGDIIERVIDKTHEDPKSMIREIIAPDVEGIEYKKRNAHKKNHLIKLFPEGMTAPIDCIIYGNSVAFYSLRKHVFVVIIESEDITVSFRTLFELAWKGCA